MQEVRFVFEDELVHSLVKIIKEAKNKLLLISPYIDISKRIQDALHEKIEKPDFELLVLFGKNEDNYYKSVKRDSFNFLKKFPNVEIRYDERLHAKFYQNDFDYIMTSLNLYDYSLNKNIEVGVVGNYATQGLIGKMIDGSDALVSQGVNKVKHDILGMDKKEVNPIEEFKKIFERSEIVYKSIASSENKNNLLGSLGGKKLGERNIIIDKLADVTSEKETITIGFKASTITLSASQLSKKIGIPQNEINQLMLRSGLVKDNIITETGRAKGLITKSYMGKDYIAYPENLVELNEFKIN